MTRMASHDCWGRLPGVALPQLVPLLLLSFCAPRKITVVHPIFAELLPAHPFFFAWGLQGAVPARCQAEAAQCGKCLSQINEVPSVLQLCLPVLSLGLMGSPAHYQPAEALSIPFPAESCCHA